MLVLDVAYGIRARVHLTMHNYADALKDAEAALASTSSVPYSSAAVSKPTFIDIEDASWMWGILITDKDRVRHDNVSWNHGCQSKGH